MRFLGIGNYNSLADMYWRLSRQGHEVRVFASEPDAHDIFHGMLTRVDAWEAQLDWIRSAGEEGIILFETASMGSIADGLRKDGFKVIGGSAWTDRIECDRAFGQEVMREMGLQTAATFEFGDYAKARKFVHGRPGRYVYKLSDGVSASTRNYVSVLASGADLIALLEFEQRRCQGSPPRFVLMDYLQGVEVGIGAYFNGHDFLTPACIDWEHKRFFPGDLGELTGEMGTVVSYRGSQRLFDLTLAKLAPQLRSAKHCGYININLIVNEAGIWPLEFTCRFGYPGFAICDALHVDGWAEIFRAMTGNGSVIQTHPGFAVGVVLTVPPFPYEYGYDELSKGAAIFIDDAATERDWAHFHFGEVKRQDKRLVTAGSLGYVMVVTGLGVDVPSAQRETYDRIGKVAIANLRYRNDIGNKLVRADLQTLRSLGYLE